MGKPDVLGRGRGQPHPLPAPHLEPGSLLLLVFVEED